MNTLQWLPASTTDIQTYNVYRSFIGFLANNAIPSDVAGKTLKLKLNGGTVQTVTFNGAEPITLQLTNGFRGGYAYTSSHDAESLVFRSKIKKAPGSVEIIGGTALAALGLVARLIEEKSEDILVAEIPYEELDEDEMVMFDDADGVKEDWYALSTVDDDDNESEKTDYRAAITVTEPVCVIEGRAVNVQGTPASDIEVTVSIGQTTLLTGTTTYAGPPSVTARTGPDGRFSLTLLRGAIAKVHIPDLGLTREFLVPNEPYAFLSELPEDDCARWGVS